MSSHIYANPDILKKVRYSRNEQEDRAEWEQREVDTYESAEDIRDSYHHSQSQEGGPQTQNPPSVQKGSFRCATLGLRVLCLLMLAGIIILSICYALNKSEFNKIKNSHSELQNELQDTKTSLTQLQSSYDKLSKNHSQLQEEVKKLKEKIEEKCPDRWTRFGSSCYFKSTESKTWSDSRRACQDKGADLVMINSKEEQEFVSKFGGYSWIGLRSKQSSGGYKWEWVDGSALRETFWAPEYEIPSYGYYGVCCDDSGRWTQSYNSASHTFMCEK
ncbi:CD209 antigen-like protein E [Pelmatolapia mariae]|uniref:CD209 antigen-like protein E n=1 Tax=Pelmatolapia mariae TaxID=158779 RepID=UPI002FE53A62